MIVAFLNSHTPMVSGYLNQRGLRDFSGALSKMLYAFSWNIDVVSEIRVHLNSRVVKIPDFKRPVGPRAIFKKARRASGLFGPFLYIVKSFKDFNQFLKHFLCPLQDYCNSA